MEATRIVSAVVKLWVLAMVAGALYFLWKDRAAPPLASDIEAAEVITHTNVDVRIGTITKMTLHGYAVGFGNVEAAPATGDEPAADARVSVDWPAVVSEVRCTEGQRVKKGQVLFVARPANGLSAGGTSAGAVGAGENLVMSPIGGTVVALDIHAGEVALPTKIALEVVDLDRLVIAATVPAWEAAAISIGQPARVEIPGKGDGANGGGTSSLKFDSSVVRVDRAADANTNLVGVDVLVPTGTTARPGEFARASITTHQRVDCLVVPADAIVRDALDRPYIGVVSEDRKHAILKAIEPGLREGDWVQVTGEGLAADETIVVSGAYGLQYRTDINVLNP